MKPEMSSRLTRTALHNPRRCTLPDPVAPLRPLQCASPSSLRCFSVAPTVVLFLLFVVLQWGASLALPHELTRPVATAPRPLPPFQAPKRFVPLLVAHAATPTDLLSGNVITNGDATQGMTGWSNSDCETTNNPGRNAFTGPSYSLFGPDDCDMSQTIPLTSVPASQQLLIDRGYVEATFSAYLGGYQDQEDYAFVFVAAYSGTGAPLFSSWDLPVVTPAMRNDQTKVMLRARSWLLPRGTRSVRVFYRGIKKGGVTPNGDCDAYATDLSLRFSLRSNSLALSNELSSSQSVSTTSDPTPSSSNSAANSYTADSISEQISQSASPVDTTTFSTTVSPTAPAPTASASSSTTPPSSASATALLTASWTPVLTPSQGSETLSRSGTVAWPLTTSLSRSLDGTSSASASVCGPSPVRGVWSLWNGTTRRPDGGYDVVEAAAVSWKEGHMFGSVDIYAVLGRRCLALVVHLVEGDAAGWTIPDAVGRSAVSLLGEARISNDMDNLTVVGGERNATVWLCTTRADGLSFDGLRSSLRVGIGARCEAGGQSLPPAAGPFLLLQLTSDALRPTALSLAVATVSKAVSREARLMPTLQRAGAGGCSPDGPSGGIWALDVGGAHEAAARYAGAVWGNVLFVGVTWSAMSLCGVCVARWWHHRDATEHSLLTAARNAHVAGLWAPIMSVVVVPLTANSVALLRQADASGAAGLAVVALHVVALSWVCVTARSRLRVEAVAPRMADESVATLQQQLTLFLRGLVQEHWAADDQACSVAFKRHAQAVLSQATAWWYCPLEAMLSIAVGVADGAGSCLASVVVGVAAQFVLAAVVAWRRPHGELIGHWATLGASLTSGVAVFLAAAAPTSTGAVQFSAALTMIAAGASMLNLSAMLLPVVLWTFLSVWRDRPAVAQPSAAVEDHRSVSPTDTTASARDNNQPRPAAVDDEEAEVGRVPNNDELSSTPDEETRNERTSNELPSDDEVLRVPSPCPTTHGHGEVFSVAVNPLIGLYNGHGPPPPPQGACRGRDPQRKQTTGRRTSKSKRAASRR